MLPISKLRSVREIMLSGRIIKNQLIGVTKNIYAAIHILLRRQ